MKPQSNANLMAMCVDIALTALLVTLIVMRWGGSVRWITAP